MNVNSSFVTRCLSPDLADVFHLCLLSFLRSLHFPCFILFHYCTLKINIIFFIGQAFFGKHYINLEYFQLHYLFFSEIHPHTSNILLKMSKCILFDALVNALLRQEASWKFMCLMLECFPSHTHFNQSLTLTQP